MKQWLIIGLVGLGLGCSQMHKDADEEGDEGNEVKMSLNDVPAPVRDTLMKEANGATIKSVDKEDNKGKTVYETDVMSGGTNWEIRVDPNGKLLSKKVDDESSEKKGDKEGDEKEEHGEHK
jgi:hypothetical protein